MVESLRLADGTLFPIPITLDVSHEDIDRLSIKPGARIALRDLRDDQPLAIITGLSILFIHFKLWLCYLTRSAVEDVYTPDRVKEAIEVFGADDPAHPSVAYLRNRVKDFYVGGKVQAIQPPAHFDYVALRCEYLFILQLILSGVLNFFPPRHTRRVALPLQKTSLAQSCRLPDPQPNAQSAP